MKTYNNLTLDEERALYAVKDASITNCTFAGPADGESALKEATNISVDNCRFELRYPFWHVDKALIKNSHLTNGCRAAFWYTNYLEITASKLLGIKAVRECHNVAINDCFIESLEFGWMTSDLAINNTELVSEYPFLNCNRVKFNNFTLRGKYSFQYVKDVEIRNSNLDTKDAFWHSTNVTVYDSVVKGEYLGWYSNNLRLVRCKIIGTQPLCYAHNLVLEDCEMIGCDLSFEKSEVNATISGQITSVKNPTSGLIVADEVSEIIIEEGQNSNCQIELRQNQ